MDNLLLETDSPFLDPNKEKNFPWNIKLSAKKIAKINNTTKEEVLENAKKNAVKLFDLKLR